MSHNTSLGSPPHVLSVSPAIISAAGATSITINGNNLSTSCQLSIPAALGTVTGPGVYTAGSGTQGDLAFPITALTPPGTPTARVCTLSNGGTASTGATVSITHQEWSPFDLMINPADTWIRAEDASAVLDGNPVASLTPGYGNRGALTSVTSNEQFTYNASVTELNGKPGLTSNYYSQGKMLFCADSSAYMVSPKDTAFSLCAVWAPVASLTVERFMSKNELGSKGWNISFEDDTNEMKYLYLNGTNAASAAFTNTNTTTPRRMMMFGGGGSDVSVVEPVTGINLTATPGSMATGTPGSHLIYGRNVHVAEMILVNRVLSSDDRVLLNNYWLARYG